MEQTDRPKVRDLGWRFWFKWTMPIYISFLLLIDPPSHLAVRIALIALGIGAAAGAIQSAYIRGLREGAATTEIT
jgi:hypothetical protein